MSDTEITWPIVHKLSRAVETPSGEVHELSLREPTVDDFLKHGVLDGGLDGTRLVDLVVTLSGLPHPTIKRLPGVEMLRVSRTLTDFFSSAAR